MSNRIVIFSSEADFGMARLAAMTVPKNWNLTLVVQSDHEASARLANIPFDTLFVADFARGGNLSGHSAVTGVANTLSSLSIGFANIGKLDADSLLISTDFLFKNGLCGIAHPKTGGSILGLSYSMPSAVALKLVPTYERWTSLGWVAGGEDVVIGGMASSSGIQDHRSPVKRLYWERYDGKKANAEHFVGHYRWRTGAKANGAQTNEDILRMSLSAMKRDFDSLSLKRRD